MPKRTADQLTGGSRDVNPQWMNIPIVQQSADGNTTIQAPLPVQRLQQKDKKSLVMELLQVYWDLPVFTPNAGIIMSFAGMLTTKNPNLVAGAGVTTPTFFAIRSQGTTLDYINRQIFTGATNDGTLLLDEPAVHDLTDNAGHGILVATDNVFVSLATIIGASTGTGVINSALCKLLYRWKEVTLEEYIGIVQSQQ